MAISASSRMRECGTDSTEEARLGGTVLFCHCVPIQPTSQLLLTQAAFGDTQHGNRRFGFRSGQTQPVSSQKNGGGYKDGARIAVNERVILSNSHRVRCGHLY